MEIKVIPELGEEGELETILFVAHDMTDFKKIEQEIKEKNKKISESKHRKKGTSYFFSCK